jgi:hypothetical protein
MIVAPTGTTNSPSVTSTTTRKPVTSGSSRGDLSLADDLSSEDDALLDSVLDELPGKGRRSAGFDDSPGDIR